MLRKQGQKRAISGSEFGITLFPDVLRALRELADVTKPRGHVLMVTYSPPIERHPLKVSVN